LTSPCNIGSPSGNSMPVQEPEAVKVKFAYQSAKITKEVKKKELNIYKQKIIVKIKPGFQILNESFLFNFWAQKKSLISERLYLIYKLKRYFFINFWFERRRQS
jgi:hypothetical protein